MSFDHPALVLAAERLTSLRAAAARVGAPDPVAVLQHVDCSPEALRASAAQVGIGHQALARAHAEFRDGVEVAETCLASFPPEADRVDAQYRAASAAAAATAAAGVSLADRLDALANETASEAIGIASEAGLFVTAVIAGDRSPDAVSAVKAACAAVTSSVRTHVESITDIAATLDPLTTPAVSATRPRVAEPGSA